MLAELKHMGDTRMSAARVGLGAALASLAVGAMAAPEDRAAFSDAQGLQVGSYVTITPTLSARIEYDDNIFQTPNNEESDFITRVRPGLDIQIGVGAGRGGFRASYTPEFGIFSSNTDDSVVNHDLQFGYLRDGAFFDFDVHGGFRRGHDSRGEGPSSGLGNLATVVFDEPPKYDEWNYGLSLGNETRSARTRMQFSYDHYDLEYQNFRALTAARDRERDDFGLELGYRTTARTYFILTGRFSEIDYDFVPVNGRNLDSDEYNYQLGFTWELTAATEGRMTIGRQQKKFDDPARKNLSATAWDVAVAWSPRTYSTFELSTGRSFRETDNVGSSIIASDISLSWRHAWSDRLATTSSFSFINDEFQDTARDDDFYRFSMQFDYDFRRWLGLGLGWSYSTRDSNIDNADFDRNVVFLEGRFSL